MATAGDGVQPGSGADDWLHARLIPTYARSRLDGVLTISNQITHSASESPVVVDGRKLRKTSLWHFSWWRILTEAVVQSRYRGVSDLDQAWILRELIHYLSGEASGVADYAAHPTSSPRPPKLLPSNQSELTTKTT